MAAGSDPGYLAGVPVALKDLIDQAGIATTAGSSFLRQPAEENAAVVDRIEAAGGVIIGRTGLHEFAYGFSSENEWFGPVRNPWDPATSPGGSSGGSAAAVAAGIAPVGVGTDTGGSIRVPAGLCGLVGLKVTHGRVPLHGVFPLAPSLDTVGPLTRTVDDAAIAYSVLAGFDTRDRWSVDQPVDQPTEERLDELRVGIPHPWVDRAVAPEQLTGLEHALAALRAAGATVEDVGESSLDHRTLPPGSYAEVAAVHREWFEAHPERYGEEVSQRLRAITNVSAEEVAEADRWRTAVSAGFDRLLARFDVLLTPTTVARAKQIGVDHLDVGEGDEPYRPALSWFTPLVNQAGLPAIAIPVEAGGVSGLPPSIQLIAPKWGEATLLGVARALERAGLVSHRQAADLTGNPGSAYNA